MYVEALEAMIEKGTFQPDAKTVAIYAEDTDLGRTVGTGFREQFTAAGWTIVAEEYFALDQTEFYPLLNKFKDLNPAVVAGTSTAPPSLAAFIKQADEVGLESVIIADGLGWVGEWYDLTGDSSNYVLDEIPTFASEEGKAFAQKFEDRFDYPPSASTGAIGYDSARIWIEIAKAAIAEAGALTSESIYNFVKNHVWTGEWTYKEGVIMKEFKWTEETIPDPVIGPDHYTFPVLQYFDGVGKVVFPFDWAEQEIQFKP
jgi:branched-chain amino acid transport system substrate-binding protein